MNKFIPLIAVLSLGLLATGCAGDDAKKLDINNNIQEFSNSVKNYSSLNDKKVAPTLQKYKLNIKAIDDTPNGVANLYNTQDTESSTDINDTNTTLKNEQKENITATENDNLNDNLDKEFTVKENNNEQEEQIITDNNVDNGNNETPTEKIDENMSVVPNDISTLYALTNDIEQYSKQYTTLKSSLEQAITDTETLLLKIKSKEVNLTAEQRMMISNQSQQLKYLANRLNNTTNTLNLALSDINELLSNNDIDGLSLKYYVLLNNLINGNEMLENGLASLYFINQLSGSNNLVPTPYGKVMYGFKRKGEPLQTYEYEIKDGEIVNEEKSNADTKNNVTETNGEVKNNAKFKNNIDSYQTNNHNIDSFFNTAMLDNQFMFGGNGMGVNGFYGAYAPYVNNNLNRTQNNFNGEETEQHSNNNQRKKSKKKLTKNIDTYRSSDTPNLLTRFKNFKQNFIKKKPKAKNPVYRYSNDDTVFESSDNTNKV